jgi:hypothetical protein
MRTLEPSGLERREQADARRLRTAKKAGGAEGI